MNEHQIRESGLAAIIVTYGNRWQYLERSVRSVLAEKAVCHLILVDNACPYPLHESLIHAGIDDARIKIIRSEENLGSAGGIRTGMEQALQLHDIEFVFILDDDNIILPGSLEQLLLTHREQFGGDPDVACLAYRPNHGPYMRKIAHGAPTEIYKPKLNNFAGFNILNLYRNYRLRVRSREAERQPLLPVVKMPVAPWSGLLIPLGLIRKCGLPDDRYFVYVDDTEYTYRINSKGGAIYMVTRCQLEDLELSWVFHDTRKKRQTRFPILDFTGPRAYYRIRNMIFFSDHHLVTNRLLFLVNRLVYSAVLFILAGLNRNWKAYRLYLRASRDALNGTMGPVLPLE